MIEKIKEISKQAKTDSSGKWVSIDDLDELILITIKDCLSVVEDAPRHCAFTTHDLGTVECTIETVLKHIHQHYNIKEQFRGYNERTLGRKISA